MGATIKPMRLGSELVGLAGEYFVAAQLCRRGYYAQLTLGNHKSVDLLVESPRGTMFRVSVKTKTAAQWMKVTGVSKNSEIIVFVDLAADIENPVIYALSAKNWEAVARSICKKKEGARFDSKTNTVYWDPWEGHPKGWYGCPVSSKDLEKFKDNWNAFR